MIESNIDKFWKFYKLEIYKLLKSKIYLYSVVLELISIIVIFISNKSSLFMIDELIISPYLNLSLTLRYLFVAIIVSATISIDMKTGLFATYISMGIKRSKLLIVKILSILSIILIGQFIGSLTYILLVIINIGLDASLINIFMYNIVNRIFII